jgi:hypothetical protein
MTTSRAQAAPETKVNKTLYLPTVPYSPVDLANRHFVATGSMRIASISEGSDFNGHSVGVCFNSYRRYWITEYWWAGRRVLARGSFERCLHAAVEEHARKIRGTSVHINLDPEAPEPVEEQERLARAAGAVDINASPWWTGAHDAVADACSWERNFPGMIHCAINFKGTKEEWPAAREKWLSERRGR